MKVSLYFLTKDEYGGAGSQTFCFLDDHWAELHSVIGFIESNNEQSPFLAFWYSTLLKGRVA
jgi:hypothetical protein